MFYIRCFARPPRLIKSTKEQRSPLILFVIPHSMRNPSALLTPLFIPTSELFNNVSEFDEREYRGSGIQGFHRLQLIFDSSLQIATIVVFIQMSIY